MMAVIETESIAGRRRCEKIRGAAAVCNAAAPRSNERSTPEDHDLLEHGHRGRVTGDEADAVLQVLRAGAGDRSSVAHRGPARPARVGRGDVAGPDFEDQAGA